MYFLLGRRNYEAAGFTAMAEPPNRGDARPSPVFRVVSAHSGADFEGISPIGNAASIWTTSRSRTLGSIRQAPNSAIPLAASSMQSPESRGPRRLVALVLAEVVD